MTNLPLNLLHEKLSGQSCPHPMIDSHPTAKLDRWIPNNARIPPKSPDRVNKCFKSTHYTLKLVETTNKDMKLVHM